MINNFSSIITWFKDLTSSVLSWFFDLSNISKIMLFVVPLIVCAGIAIFFEFIIPMFFDLPMFNINRKLYTMTPKNTVGLKAYNYLIPRTPRSLNRLDERDLKPLSNRDLQNLSLSKSSVKDLKNFSVKDMKNISSKDLKKTSPYNLSSISSKEVKKMSTKDIRNMYNNNHVTAEIRNDYLRGIRRLVEFNNPKTDYELAREKSKKDYADNIELDLQIRNFRRAQTLKKMAKANNDD